MSNKKSGAPLRRFWYCRLEKVFQHGADQALLRAACRIDDTKVR
jgi:hypothetical protein